MLILLWFDFVRATFFLQAERALAAEDASAARDARLADAKGNTTSAELIEAEAAQVGDVDRMMREKAAAAAAGRARVLSFLPLLSLMSFEMLRSLGHPHTLKVAHTRVSRWQTGACCPAPLVLPHLSLCPASILFARVGTTVQRI